MKRLLYQTILIICLAITAGIIFSHTPSKINKVKKMETHMKISSNECFPKGGLGVVNINLHIALRSKSNELILKPVNRWIGLGSNERQVVFVWNRKVINMTEIPSDFNLENSVIVSFEHDKISFFDFNDGTGGFYRRDDE